MQSSIIIIDDDRDCVICIPQVTCFELRNWPRARSLPLAFLLPLFPILAPASIFSSVLAPTPPPSFFLRAAASLFLPFHSSKPEECSSGFFSMLKKSNKPVPTSASIFIAWDDNWSCPLLKKHQYINTRSYGIVRSNTVNCTLSPVKNEAASLLFLLRPSRDLKKGKW